MFLGNNCEVVGFLSEIKFEDDHVKLVFTIAREIKLPSDAFSYDQLKAVLGKRVGIFNHSGRFFLRQKKSG